MSTAMSETAATPQLPDNGAAPAPDSSLRDRLGVAAFVVVAVVATTSWIALLVWGVLKLVKVL
jgi:hypothetical protein